MSSISIVVPVYNEEGNVALLHEEIKAVCEANQFDYQIIFINDGSTDNTSTIAKSLSPLKLIEFRKNFGQTAAMDAGIRHSTKEFIVTMDGDRQNDPNDIPKLVSHLLENNYDVVSGWRKHRKDSALKRFVSRGANFLRSVLVHDGIHDSGCSLKVYRRECFKSVTLFGEMHRFIPAILKIKGFKIGEIVVNHRPRVSGITKYNWRRTFKGFIDMISVWFWNKYAVRPLHLLGGLGLISVLGGLVCLLVAIYVKLVLSRDLSETVLPLLSVSLFLTGIQLFVAGLMADILSKNYYETTKDESYNIREISNL